MKNIIKNLSLVLFLILITQQNIKAQATFSWAKNIGGTDYDYGTDVAIDTAGNIYITGGFKGTVDFDPGAGVLNLTSNLNGDAFVCKLDPNGNLIWAKNIGGSSFLDAQQVKVDNNNNVYFIGNFYGTVDFDPGAGTFNLTSNGDADMYICKLNSLGNFIWAKTWGSNSTSVRDEIRGIEIDNNGDIYTTGWFIGEVDFDPNAGIFNLGVSGSSQMRMFLSKLDPNGNLVWAKTAAGSVSHGYGLTIDANSDILITGSFEGVVDFDFGAGTFNLASTSLSNSLVVFVLKTDLNGNFIWVKAIGNLQGAAEGQAIATDANNNVVIVGDIIDFNGVSSNTDMDPGAGIFNLPFSGLTDGFVLKLDANGVFIWAKHTASTSCSDNTTDVAIDNCGNIYTTGHYACSADLDPGIATFILPTASGNSLTYVQELDAAGNLIWAGTVGDGFSASIIVDEHFNIYIVGDLLDPQDMDPGSGVFTLTSNGSHDISISKLTGIQTCCVSIPPVITPLSSTTFCSGDSVTLDAGTGYTSYQWLPSNDTTQTITIGSTGNYAVITTDVCGSDTSAVVNVTVTPSSSFNQALNECNGFSVTVGPNTYNTTGIFIDTLTTSTGCDSIITTDLTINASSSTTQVFNECEGFSVSVGTNTYNTTGTYTDVINGCDTILTNLTILPNPAINLNNDLTITQGTSTSLIATGGGTYLWYPSTGLSCDTCSSTTATPLFSTNYCVQVSSPNGCVDTECVNVNVDFQCGELFVPNVFSPNGDGNNDLLEVKINQTCVSSFNIKIFDRWGAKIFESDDINNSWDGTYRGKELNNAVFVYDLNVSLINSETSISKKGNVSIIK